MSNYLRDMHVGVPEIRTSVLGNYASKTAVSVNAINNMHQANCEKLSGITLVCASGCVSGAVTYYYDLILFTCIFVSQE